MPAFPGNPTRTGRFVKRITIMVVMLGMLLGTAMPVLADEAGGGNKMPGWPLRWKATSPSTHEGDRYTLLVTNNSDEVQEAQIRTRLMDHPEISTNVIDEMGELVRRLVQHL